MPSLDLANFVKSRTVEENTALLLGIIGRIVHFSSPKTTLFFVLRFPHLLSGPLNTSNFQTNKYQCNTKNNLDYRKKSRLNIFLINIAAPKAITMMPQNKPE